MIIPIANHPDGVGFETNPLDPAAIGSGQIIFDTGGGDDLLGPDSFPSGLDVNVAAGAGNDTTTIHFASDRHRETITIRSESIVIDSTTSPVTTATMRNSYYQATSSFGTVGQQRQWNLGSGILQVSGRLIVTGDATLSGQRPTVDLSSAILTTASSDTTLAIDLQSVSGSDLTIGGADDSAGQFIRQINVQSATTVSFTNSATLVAGDLLVNQASTIQVSADIDTTVGACRGQC